MCQYAQTLGLDTGLSANHRLGLGAGNDAGLDQGAPSRQNHVGEHRCIERDLAARADVALNADPRLQIDRGRSALRLCSGAAGLERDFLAGLEGLPCRQRNALGLNDQRCDIHALDGYAVDATAATNPKQHRGSREHDVIEACPRQPELALPCRGQNGIVVAAAQVNDQCGQLIVESQQRRVGRIGQQDRVLGGTLPEVNEGGKPRIAVQLRLGGRLGPRMVGGNDLQWAAFLGGHGQQQGLSRQQDAIFQALDTRACQRSVDDRPLAPLLCVHGRSMSAFSLLRETTRKIASGRLNGQKGAFFN